MCASYIEVAFCRNISSLRCRSQLITKFCISPGKTGFRLPGSMRTEHCPKYYIPFDADLNWLSNGALPMAICEVLNH